MALLAGNPSVPGEKRGGRQKGTPNKPTLDVIRTLKRLGCNPIEEMVAIAQDTSVEMSIRARLYLELAQYVAPKRKAVEVGGIGGAPIKTEHSLVGWLEHHSGKTLGPPSERKPIEIVSERPKVERRGRPRLVKKTP